MYHFNGPVLIIGAGSVEYQVILQITLDAWAACDEDVQAGVTNILANQPVSLLSSSQRGNGIKLESKGLEFHTQTNKRLQAPGVTKLGGGAVWTFTQCKKGWGH